MASTISRFFVAISRSGGSDIYIHHHVQILRNTWHIHEAASGGGQILLCTSGRGWYQEWGKPARELHAGDVVHIPAGVKHWHGAARDSWFVHLAVEVPGEGCRSQWLEPVSEEEYARLP